MRVGLVVACLVVGACTPRPAPIVVVLPPPAASAAPVVVPAPMPKGPPMHALVLGGAHAIGNAAWMPDGSVVATTREQVWRFRPEAPDVVRMAPLALSAEGPLAVARPGGRVAIALEDGGIDVFEPDGARLRTLPPGRHVLELRFSPDGGMLAVTRTNDNDKGEWFERTSFVDLATAATKGTVDGGEVVFDATGKRVAARGGVFEVETGHAVGKVPEGMYVLFDAGVWGDMHAAHSGVVAGDYAARGWMGATAYYGMPLAKDISMVGPAGEITRFAASCAPGKKLATVADDARGRILSVCTDGVVVSDIAKRSSNKIVFPISKQTNLFAPELIFLPEGDAFSVRSRDFPIGIFDPVAGTARNANATERLRVWDFALDEGCADAAYPSCDNAAWRPDNAFRMRVHAGFAVWPKGESWPVIDWGMEPLATRVGAGRTSRTGQEWTNFEWRSGGLEVIHTDEHHATTSHYRLDQKAPSDSPFPATAVCGNEPSQLLVEDGFALYSAYGGKDRVTSTVVCHCTARGCVKTAVGGMAEPIAANDDGSFVTTDVDTYGRESVVTLRSPGHAPVRAKVRGSCIKAAFGPQQHIFLSCNFDRRGELVELATPTLKIVRHHRLPAVGYANKLLRAGDAILVMTTELNGWFGALLDADWLATDTHAHEPPMLYAWPTFGIVQRSDGKVTLHGDQLEAAQTLRCYDGIKLTPFDTCRDAVTASVGP